MKRGQDQRHPEHRSRDSQLGPGSGSLAQSQTIPFGTAMGGPLSRSHTTSLLTNTCTRRYVYGTAKATASAFPQGLTSRLYRYGVNVTTFKLGFVDTPMTTVSRKVSLGFCAHGRNLCNHSNKKQKQYRISLCYLEHAFW